MRCACQRRPASPARTPRVDRDDEAVVVRELSILMTASAAWPCVSRSSVITWTRPFGGSAALHAEAQQVHARKSRGRVRLTREHGLVADHDAVLVGGDFRAPHPERAAEQHGVGHARLLDLDPRAAQRRTWRMRPRGCHSRNWASFGSRSLFLANSTRPGRTCTSVSHMPEYRLAACLRHAVGLYRRPAEAGHHDLEFSVQAVGHD